MEVTVSPSLRTDSTTRYSRQLELLGKEGQKKLKEATVFIAGVGGLGGTTAMYLAAAGIGKLILAHEGKIKTPDMNRQVLMDSERIGEERMACAIERLQQINPQVELEGYAEKISYDRTENWVKDADVVIDARYDFPERYELNRLCVDYRKPMVEAAMYEFDISLTTIIPGVTPCLACMYPMSDPDWRPHGFPVLGATSGIVGCFAAMEAVKCITGIGKPLVNELFRFDSLTFQSYKINLKRNAHCPHCSSLKGE